MLTVGLVVEGDFDAVALPEFIRTCLGADTEVIPLRCRSKSQLMKKFPGFLEGFRYATQGEPVDRALIVRDADNNNPAELITAIRDKYATRSYPFPVEPVVIVQELETWLLADNVALSQICNRNIPEVQITLEGIPDPKTHLKRILSDAKVPYTQETARRIAAAADVERVQYRCPHFRHFRSVLS